MKVNTTTSDLKECPIQSTFGAEIMYVVHSLYSTVEKRLESVLLSNKQISFSQFMVLTGFFCKDISHMTQAKLAEHLMLTEATVSRHIKVLVEKKFLSKEKETHNKKSYTLTLTPLGIKAYEKAGKIISQELDTYFSPVSSTDQAVIIKNFNTITNSIQEKKL